MPYRNVECVKAGTLHTKEKQELNTSDFIFQASERLNYKWLGAIFSMLRKSPTEFFLLGVETQNLLQKLLRLARLHHKNDIKGQLWKQLITIQIYCYLL